MTSEVQSILHETNTDSTSEVESILYEKNTDSTSCRICLEDDDQNNMITPCMCIGTSKYIHRSCLDQWRISETNNKCFTHCCQCNFAYNIYHYNYQDDCITKIIKFLSKYILIFFILNNLIIFSLSLIIKRLDTNHNIHFIPNHSFYFSCYILSLFIFIFVCFFIFLLTLIKFRYKKLYFSHYKNINYHLLFGYILALGCAYFINKVFVVMALTFILQHLIEIHYKIVTKLINANDNHVINMNDEDREQYRLSEHV